MKRNINKHTSETIDAFLIASNTGHIEKTEFGTSQDLFAHIDDRKRVISYLKGNGLDPFKRGTKEPEAIAAVLKNAGWTTIKEISPDSAGVRSMWD